MTTRRDDTELTLLEHLVELRERLAKAVLALILGTLVSVVFAGRGLRVLLMPLGDTVPQTIHPTESFIVYFRVALIGGVILAMPIIVYQLVRFILPGLLPEERKYLYFLLPGATFFFALGVAFAAFVMLPAAINFMRTFLAEQVDFGWSLDSYIAFVTRVLFWMGIVFQTPLIIFFFAKLEIVSAKQLGAARKYAVLVIAIIAAIVTPTPDPVNMAIVMVPLYLLYEIGIILARIAAMGKKDTAAA